MTQFPARHTIPPGLVTLADHEQHARTQLDDNAWAYFSGGAADEISLHANRSAWDALPLWPRVLRPLAGGHTRVSLLGRTLAHPILLAPVAFQRLAHPDGELAMAYAAAALGAGVVLSTQASVSLESVAQAVLPDPGRGPLWFQLYLQPDRDFTQALVRRTEAAGYEALVLTVDAPTSGVRDRERRAGFRLPPGVGPVNLAGLQAPTPSALGPGQSALFDGLLHHAPTWDDIAWLQSITRLPVLLKGVLHPADARQASSCPTMAGARWTRPLPPPPRCLVWCRPCRARCRCWWTAASGAAPMCSRPWRWAPPPCWWVALPFGAWPMRGRRAWPMCCACCATNWRSPWP